MQAQKNSQKVGIKNRIDYTRSSGRDFDKFSSKTKLFNGNSDTNSRVSINDVNYMRDIPVYNIGNSDKRQSPVRPMTANNFYQKSTPISSVTSSMLINQ